MATMNNEHCLVMFAKYPEKGKVKTRLILDRGEGSVADLYRCFIEDLLERFSTEDHSFCLAYDPPERKNDFVNLFGNGFLFLPQHGADLGIRMYNALITCFLKGFKSVVVIGSDSPDLPRFIIEEAFLSLDEHGAVIGPTWDGGYYLIGFSRDSLSRRFFEDIEWSTAGVFQKTMEHFREGGVSVHILPKWRDIDRYEDIHFLMKEYGEADLEKSRTIRFLKEHGFTTRN